MDHLVRHDLSAFDAAFGAELDPLPSADLNGNAREKVLPAVIPSGQRNKTLHPFARSMHAWGASAEAIYAALIIENTRCEPAYSDDEIAQLAHHAATQRDAPGFDPTPGPRALIGGTEPASGDTDGFPDTDLEDAMIVACEGQQIARDGVRYLVDGIIPDYGTVGFSVAFAKVGKTTFSQGLAAAVAMGRPFLDRATTRAKVLVLAAEDPAEYTAWLARHLDVEAGWMTFRRKSLILDPHGLARARTTIARGGYGFVLIASWQAVVRGLIRDENDNAGAVRVVEDVKAAARLTGVPWLIDAHSGKGEDQHDDADPSRAMRGASSAAGAADYTLSLRYANGAFGAQRRLSGKGRFVAFEPVLMEFDVQTSTYTPISPAKDAMRESTWSLICAAGILTTTPQTVGVIAQAIGLVDKHGRATRTGRRQVGATLTGRAEVLRGEVVLHGKKTSTYCLCPEPTP